MAKVVSTPQPFKQKDMTRAIKAAAAAGAKFIRFTVGKMVIEVPTTPEVVSLTPPKPAPSNEETTSGAA